MYAEYIQSQLTFLALLPSMFYDLRGRSIETSFWRIWDEAQIYEILTLALAWFHHFIPMFHLWLKYSEHSCLVPSFDPDVPFMIKYSEHSCVIPSFDPDVPFMMATIIPANNSSKEARLVFLDFWIHDSYTNLTFFRRF